MYTTIRHGNISRVFHTHKPTDKLSMSRGSLDGHRTRVDWKTNTIEGNTVGVKMKALIGPEHQQGGPPKASALSKLMSKLVTKPNLPSKNKYIKGHLLNDNIGGPGEYFNLFPITADANRRHENSIEHYVKKWVNIDKHWVDYEVNVVGIDYKLDGHKSENYVNCTFACQANILLPISNNKFERTGHVVRSWIPSRYEQVRLPIRFLKVKPFVDNMSDERRYYIHKLSKAKKYKL